MQVCPAKYIKWILGVIILVYGTRFNAGNINQEFAERNPNRIYEIEYLDAHTVKLTHKFFGTTRLVNISSKPENPFDIKNVQIFDLTNEDTTNYNYKYQRKRMFPVSGLSGYPLVIGDFNNNGKTDFTGTYKIPISPSDAEAAIVELSNDTTFHLRKIYHDTVAIALAETDYDHDSLKELNFKIIGGRFVHSYESSHPDSFPNVLNLTYKTGLGAVGAETFTFLDNDSLCDLLYLGKDNNPPLGQKIMIAEYNPATQAFEKRFHYKPPDGYTYGFSHGDFDGDGYEEFVNSSINGWVYVFENSGNDAYDLVFTDTLTTSNAYLTTATNDIDGNGKEEFFVGGTAYYGGVGASRIYWFESDGDNHYQKVRSFFLVGTSIFGVSRLFNYDVNYDGVDDLVFSFTDWVVILTWNPSGYLELVYLDLWENWDQTIEGLNIHDSFGDGIPHLFVSVLDGATPPMCKTVFYKNNFLIAGMKNNQSKIIKIFELYPNYPNPFNSQTIIRFKINRTQNLNLSVYDLTGKEVIRLINDKPYLPGEYQMKWDGLDKSGKEVSSGIYIYQLNSRKFSKSKKMILIR